MAHKKHLRKIIFLATLLLALSILLYFQNLQKVKQKQRKAQTQNTISQRLNMLEQLPSWNRQQIIAISLETSPSPDNSESSRLELQKDKARRWQLQFPKGIPARPGAVEQLALSSLGLWGQKLASSFDLMQETSQTRYGFHSAQLTINYFGPQSDQLAARVLVGAKIPGIGGYYATAAPASGDVSQASLFRLTDSQFNQLAVTPSSLRTQQLSELALLGQQGQHLNILELRGSRNIIRVEFNNAELAKKYSHLNELQSFVMTKPYPIAQGVDQYVLEQLLQNMPNPIKIANYVEDQPKDLAIYGLDKAQRKSIYAEDSTGKILHLWLGKEQNISSVYAMQADYASVFTVSKDVLAVLQFDPFMLVDKFVALINIDKVEQVRLRFHGGEQRADYRLQILHVLKDGVKNATPSEEGPKTQVTGGVLRAGGQQRRKLNEELSKELYQNFLSLFLVGEVSGSFFPVNKAEASLIYSFRSSPKALRRVDFYNYSAKDYYVVSRDEGKAIFVTEKRQLQQLQQTLKQVLQTGQIDIVR